MSKAYSLKPALVARQGRGGFETAMKEIVNDQITAQMEFLGMNPGVTAIDSNSFWPTRSVQHEAQQIDRESSEKKVKRKQRLNQIFNQKARATNCIKPTCEIEDIAH